MASKISAAASVDHPPAHGIIWKFLMTEAHTVNVTHVHGSWFI